MGTNSSRKLALEFENKVNNPRDRMQKFASLRRTKATIERNLASASLSGVKTDIAIAEMKIDSAENLLNPKVIQRMIIFFFF